ncbi:WD40/YVTN/BNR-like repeat-containing protein [Burkholderia stagnalis]
MIRTFIAGAAFAALCVSIAAFAQSPGAAATVATWVAMPAHTWAAPSRMMLTDAARAGTRIVAVGEHGVVLLSDDDGRSYRQARRVPVSATLSAVTFADARHGWAVGQWGVIVATRDGGETWEAQRIDTSVDQPLFSVFFANDRDGIAVGLWSLMLQTHDGGNTWTRTKLPKPPGGGKADRNLYHAFGDGQGAIYVVAEQGTVLKSTDGGANWTYLDTGGKGSLWAGVALPDGRIVVGGLLGSLIQSGDGGKNWSPLNSGTRNSITDLVAAGNGLAGVGLNGLMLSQRAAGAPVDASQLPDRVMLTAILIDSNGRPVLVSQEGALATH